MAMTEAEEIVAALAEFDAPNEDGTYANGNDWCKFCSTANATKPGDHEPDFVWRRAREYMRKLQENRIPVPHGQRQRAIVREVMARREPFTTGWGEIMPELRARGVTAKRELIQRWVEEDGLA